MHAKLKALRHNADCLIKDLAKITQEIHECEQAIVAKDGHLGIEVGYQPCPDSPINFCVYVDGDYEECVYCGEPEDRQ